VPLGLGIWEILILAGILVLLFGAKGAPKMARRLGGSVKEMKDAVTEMDPRTILDPKDKPAEAPQRQLEATKAVPVAAAAPAAAAPAAGAPVAVAPEPSAAEPATPEGESPAS
jgi:sec-independent protein translocase protein TatA